MAGSPHVKETTAAPPPPPAVLVKADLIASLLLSLSEGNGLKFIGILKADLVESRSVSIELKKR